LLQTLPNRVTGNLLGDAPNRFPAGHVDQAADVHGGPASLVRTG
jgi:hypothetical protein